MQVPLQSNSRRQTQVGTNALAAPPALEPAAGLNAAERAQLAEQLGYRQIGAELPDGVSLSDIVQTLPKEVRQELSLLWPAQPRH